MRWTVSFFFAAALLGVDLSRLPLARADSPEKKLDEAVLIEGLEKNLGKIVPAEKMPETYALLQTIYNRLEPTYNRLTGASHAGKVIVIDSAVANAMVASPVAFPDGKVGNIIVVTKGLLELFATRLPENKIPEALAGILGHEFGHPAVKFDSYSFKEHYTRWSYNQAEELRADFFAIELLAESGLPRDCLRTGLDVLLVGETPQLSYSTHPESTFRMVVQELGVTHAQYKKGEVALIPLAAPSAGALREITPQSPPAAKWKLAQPAEGIVGLVHQLQSYRGEGQHSYEYSNKTRAEFVHLYFTLLERLKGKAPALSSQEESALLDFMGELAHANLSDGKRRYPDFYVDFNDLSRNGITQKSMGWTHGNTKKIYDLVDSVPFFHSPRYLAWYREQFSSLEALDISYGTHRLTSAAKIAPIDVILEVNGQEAMKTYSGNGQGYFFVSAEEHGASRMEFKLEAYRLKEKIRSGRLVREEFSTADILGGFNEAKVANRSPKFLREKIDLLHSEEERARLKSEWFDYLEDPKNKIVRESLTEVAREIWSQKGRFGILDIWKTTTDWESVFHLLKIKPSDGYRELNHSTQEFVTSPQYKELRDEIGRFGERRLLPNRDPHSSNRDKPEIRPQRTWVTLDTADVLLKKFENDPDAREALFRARTEVAERELLQTFRESLVTVGSPLDEQKMERLLETLLKRFPFATNVPFPAVEFRNIARIIDEAPISAKEKRIALKYLFIDRLPRRVGKYGELEPTWVNRVGGSGYRGNTTALEAGWIFETSDEANIKTFRLLQKNGVVSSPSLFLDSIYGFHQYETPGNRPTANILDGAGMLEDFLIEEVNQIDRLPPAERAKALDQFSARIFDPYPNHDTVRFPSGQGERLQTRVLKMAETGLSDEARLRIFLTVTKPGTPRGAENFVSDHLTRALKTIPLEGLNRTGATALLEKGFVARVQDQVALAERLLASDLEMIKKTGPNPENLKTLLDQVDAILPKTSSAREPLLEKLAWGLKLTERPHLLAIEGRKTLNWERIDPRIIHAVSGLSSYFKSMDQAEMIDLITYFVDEGRSPVPASVHRVIEQDSKELAKRSVGAFSKATEEEMARTHKSYIDTAEESLARLARGTTSVEKIALFHWAMRMGAHPLAGRHDLATFVARNYLGYGAGGKNERFLLAFLDSVPESEHLASLAYLISTAKQKGGDAYTNIAKAFGTPGIKAGQQISIWNLLGEQVSRDLESLKDNAGPMSLLEITDAIRTQFPPEVSSRLVSVDQVLGSASIKTVAEATVREPNGRLRKVVVMVQRPFSSQRITANLGRMKRLLTNLQKHGFDLNSVGLGKMLDAVERQLASETRMKIEAQHFRDAAQFYETAAESLATLPKRWKFSVPKGVAGFDPTDAVLVMERVQGTAFKNLPPSELKESIGRAIVSASLRGLFRQGWFDPDRHTGNILIDSENQIIHMIDFGQATRFKKSVNPLVADGPYLLSRLLLSLKAGNAQSTLTALEQIAREQNPAQRGALKDAIEKIYLSTSEPGERVTRLVTAMSEHGMVMKDEYLSSALKGLKTLSAENYVTPQVFQEILKAEITRVLVQKAPRTLLDTVMKAGCLGRILLRTRVGK